MTNEVLFVGSVKNILKGSEETVLFEYSDRFSVFDWGGMPDTLDGKGESLAFMAKFFNNFLGDAKNWESWELPRGLEHLNGNETLAKLRKEGVKHHGVLGQEPISKGNNTYEVNKVNIIEPRFENGSFDYSEYKNKPTKSLIPLEVIFRFGVPRGSSLLKRTKDPVYLKEIGLVQAPLIEERFTLPLIEYSTKLEPQDRYIGRDKAQEMAGMTEVENKRLNDLVLLISLRLKNLFHEINVDLWDGKFEFGFGEMGSDGSREIILVDSIGPDELRLTYDGIQLSKETLRQFYRSSDWHENVEKAKVLADERGEKDWKTICEKELNSTPPLLDPVLKDTYSMMYKSIANGLSKKFMDKVVFENNWSLPQIVKILAGGVQ